MRQEKSNAGFRIGAPVAAALSISAAAIAFAVFASPHNLASLAHDKQVSISSAYYIWIFRVVAAHAGIFCLFVSAGLLWRRPVGAGAETAPPPAERRNYATGLFIASFLILFMELALIRWIPAYVKLMSYFTNFLLLACFLGMGLGCLAAGARVNYLRAAPALLAAAAAAALLIFSLGGLNIIQYYLSHYGGQEIFFSNTIHRASGAGIRDISISLIIGLIYILVALAFVGPGQAMGRLFDRFDNPLKAYAVNIGASIAGIVCFSALSFFSAPAWIWFAASALLLIWLMRATATAGRAAKAAMLAVLVSAVFVVGLPRTKNDAVIWSPYYKIYYSHPVISVNEIGHQIILSSHVRGGAPQHNYNLPYLLPRDAAGRSFDDVLVIGAGSGNDVSNAIKYGVRRIDAVEIDPSIISLGRIHHPDRPYDDPRVRIINDDGRSFLRKTTKKYDMIVYALVDSITLMSGFSSVRLETYLFTEEAFRDIRDHLKPGGVFVMYNFFRENWLTIRLYEMLERVFDQQPLLTIIPPTKNISEKASASSSISVFMAGDIAAVKASFEKYGAYRIPSEQLPDYPDNGFSAPPHGPDTTAFFDTRIVDSAPAHIPTDNWPFVYLRRPGLPSHNLVGLLAIAAISLALACAFTGFTGLRRISIHYFFLGGAFMLLETESVVKLALIHGSTWFVNSVVFTSVLAMVFAANAYVMRRAPRSSIPAYALLFAALALNYFAPLELFLGKSWLVENALSCLVMFLPIAFAGVIFANSFRRSSRPALDMGSNLLGIICGGIAEYASLAFGYNALLLLAAGMYFLSLLSLPRGR